MKTRSLIPCLLALAWLPGAALDSSAAALVVTNLANSGPGTLRDAVAFASTNAGGAVITFAPALDGQIILVQPELVLSNQVTIDASALTNGITLSATLMESAQLLAPETNRVFEVAANTVAELDNLTVQGGVAAFVGGSYAVLGNSGGKAHDCGGGIVVDNGAGTLTLNHCTISGNFAEYYGGAIDLLAGSTFTVTLNNCAISNNVALYGGGIYNDSGTVTVNNSTLSANAAGLDGGAFYNSLSGNVTLNRSTVCNNFAVRQGGGIFNLSVFAVNNSTLFANSAARGGGIWDAGGSYLNNSTFSGNGAVLNGGGVREVISSAILTNTIVAGNTAPTNANASSASSGVVLTFHSLTSGDPLLALPGNYGGPTLTMPPLAGSPAIDAGDDSVTNFLTTDQRGYGIISPHR